MPEPTPARILVTAFEPFGPPGQPKRPSNASEEVLRAFGARFPGRCELLVLPVDARSEVRLARGLNGNPVGIVSMGEAGLPGTWDTNVEVRAYDVPLSATGVGAAPVAESTFAPRLHLLQGMEREERIGTYWCNRAYFLLLQWCARFERPAVFLHLRVEGDRERQALHLDHVVRALERETAAVQGR